MIESMATLMLAALGIYGGIRLIMDLLSPERQRRDAKRTGGGYADGGGPKPVAGKKPLIRVGGRGPEYGGIE